MSTKNNSRAKLQLELVPASMWGKNVRAVVSRESWDALRWLYHATQDRPDYMKLRRVGRFGYAGDSLKCAVCAAKQEQLELHEVWDYNDKKKIQKLVNLIPVCDECHMAMHLGRASQLGLADRAVTHLQKVNGWSSAQAKIHIDDAFRVWAGRSKESYILDLSWLESEIQNIKIHPEWLAKRNRWIGDRLDAIGWACEILSSDALILDTETTGLLTYKDAEIIELSIIDMKGKVLYDGRFKPLHKIPKRAVNINGITNTAVRQAPRFDEEYERIAQILHGKTTVAYKAEFDRKMIGRTAALFNLPPPECRWECAMYTYKAFSESSRFLPLPGAAHSAKQDCKAILKLLKKMARP